MILGTILLWVAVVGGVVSVALASAAARRPALARAFRIGLGLHVAGSVGALALMLASFLVTDVRLQYVWSHTFLDYPTAYKVAGLWGGQEGTILLWGGLVALFAHRVSRAGAGIHAAAAQALVLLSTSLMTIALTGDAFRTTSALELASAPNGSGLADVLVTPLMVIHPPIQFVAYALLAVPAAYALAGWLLGDTARAWIAPAYRWARPAWLFATIGLGLGALWAYYVLSFGGYWAWDPVETSNLLPWLALTGFLHAGKNHLRFGDHPLSAPVLAVAGFLLTIFATFATRSGLWVSVHAFTDPTNRFEPDAAARLMGILGAHMATRAFLAIFTAALIGSVALLLVHEARAHSGALRRGALVFAGALFAFAGLAAADVRFFFGLLFEAARLLPLPVTAGTGLIAALLVGLPPVGIYLMRDSAEREAPARIEPRTLMTAAVALLGVATVVAFLLNMQVVNGQDRGLFDARAPLIALPIVALLTLMMALGPLGRTRALVLAGAGLVTGLAGAFLFPGARVLALTAPPLAAAIIALSLKLVQVQGRSAPMRLRIAGSLLLAAGVLGMLQWSNPPSEWLGIRMPPAVASGLIGFLLAATGVIGSIAMFRSRGWRLALVGSLGGVVAVGYGVGAVLALAALLLAWRERSGFAREAGFARHEAARLRETGIHLLHLALMIGLLGYAASTYSQDTATFTGFEPGSTAVVGDLELSVHEAQGVASATGGFDEVTHRVMLTKNGREMGEMTLRLAWQGEPRGSYDTELAVRRTLFADIYLQPMAFHTAADGWVSEGASAKMTSLDVDAITFRVAVLPLMTLLWGGLWMMGLGMGLILVGTRLRPDTDAPPREQASNAAAASRRP